MRKVALVFVLAVIVPSLVLAWLAVRSLRDQQYLLERQQSLLYQAVADSAVRRVQDLLAALQQEFSVKVDEVSSRGAPIEAAVSFDEAIRQARPLAEVGFVVSLTGDLLAPPAARPEARAFLEGNGRFLASREAVQVYLDPKQAFNNALINRQNLQVQAPDPAAASSLPGSLRTASGKMSQARSVIPQQQAVAQAGGADDGQQLSRLASAEAEFSQLIGQQTGGTLARFVDNRLTVLLWHRPASAPHLVFGASLALSRLAGQVQDALRAPAGGTPDGICLAVLNDAGKPVALTHPDFIAHWKRPFAATEIGELLPHWEVAVYLLNPAQLTHSARTVRLTLGLLILVLVLAIAVGSWLIVSDLNRQLTLARQKTDFVSNVSHELKTPLTSIRMFADLLAEGRVTDPARQKSYLKIISAEGARLTRLINNVLDFARLERGDKKYHPERCDLPALVRETVNAYRPHLESSGFQFQCEIPECALWACADRDALAQALLNLLSNAEKYSNGQKEVRVILESRTHPLPHADIKVLDRGPGVPPGCREKIFEKFYRAHDALSGGIQGSGLGLTLARQIARAHGGDVLYAPREGGGSCFILRLPLSPDPPAG